MNSTPRFRLGTNKNNKLESPENRYLHLGTFSSYLMGARRSNSLALPSCDPTISFLGHRSYLGKRFQRTIILASNKRLSFISNSQHDGSDALVNTLEFWAFFVILSQSRRIHMVTNETLLHKK
ncbi:hypothetical protein FRC03_004017 [Tulasnella sp. 419]|nr:hypothetical protein FRC03_004017 [Tulasnella sp. 419]